MKPNFRAQFAPESKNGFVGSLESRTRVFLLQATYQGKQVYYYLQTPSYRQQRFKQMLLLSKPIKVSQYGNILACGYGNPSPALRHKMENKFRVFDFVDR